MISMVMQLKGLLSNQSSLVHSEDVQFIAIVDGTRNSLDLDHINQDNDRRLERLRELGFSSVGDNDADELSKLNALVNKFKN